jgi:uncharacterized protein (DUF362 family)/ferredoxin
MGEVQVRAAAYEGGLAEVVRGMLDQAGLGPRMAGSQVLIKPNWLMPAPPEKAVTTHPQVVRAAAEFVLDHGGRVLVADSPALGSLARLEREGGYAKALAGLPVARRTFEATVGVDVGPPFGAISLAREAVEADLILNLAKLKTHSQMRLTLGVKNLFGCVVGLAKPEWHLRAGVDRDLFARLLVQIHRALAPAYTLVDGVLAMEGDGSGKGGIPRHLGLLVGGADAFAVDAAIAGLLGLDPLDLPILAAARRLGVDLPPPRVDGRRPAVADFRIPDPGPATLGPAFLQRLLRRHWLKRPVLDRARCRSCGDCWRYCPAEALAAEGEQPVFDYGRCIRCYCCVEVCPHGALVAADPWAARLWKRLRGR